MEFHMIGIMYCKSSMENAIIIQANTCGALIRCVMSSLIKFGHNSESDVVDLEGVQRTNNCLRV